MDEVHCVIAVTSELARFLSAADKTPLQRLSYMSCRPPLTLAGFGVFDGAKLHKKNELATIIFQYRGQPVAKQLKYKKNPCRKGRDLLIYQNNNLIKTIQLHRG